MHVGEGWKRFGPVLIGLLFLFTEAAYGLRSGSKLGIHIIQNNTAGVRQICNAHPRVIKILDLQGSMLAAARNYKASTPDGIVVLRIFTTKYYSLTDNPAASAADFANTVLLPKLNLLSAADRALIDYVEGPNECESTPCWGSVEEAAWYNDFWVALAPLIADAGFKPCAFSIGVGGPPGELGEMQQKLAAIVPALRVCKQLGGAWSYHAYTPNWSTDSNFQWWYSLRYRQFYSFFAQSYPDLVNLPIILTEGGFDSGGSPTLSGWQANGTATQYEDWLTWWDAHIREDSYVLGSTLFQIGTSNWPSFDLEPIAGWFASYLGTQTAPSLSCSPLTLSSETIVGGNAAPTSFTVVNAGLNILTYSISENAFWMSVDPTSGTSTGEADSITVSFASAGLTPGTYTTSITVTAPGADNTPQTIGVTLTVREPPVPGDLNEDRHVDYHDVAIFLPCITGPAQGPPAIGCDLADIDSDDDVDQSDFGLLQRCMTGDTVFGDPNCAS